MRGSASTLTALTEEYGHYWHCCAYDRGRRTLALVSRTYQRDEAFILLHGVRALRLASFILPHLTFFEPDVGGATSAAGFPDRGCLGAGMPGPCAIADGTRVEFTNATHYTPGLIGTGVFHAHDAALWECVPAGDDEQAWRLAPRYGELDGCTLELSVLAPHNSRCGFAVHSPVGRRGALVVAALGPVDVIPVMHDVHVCIATLDEIEAIVRSPHGCCSSLAAAWGDGRWAEEGNPDAGDTYREFMRYVLQSGVAIIEAREGRFWTSVGVGYLGWAPEADLADFPGGRLPLWRGGPPLEAL